MSAGAMKTCTKCGKPYPATTDFFPRQTQKKDGLSYWCKNCKREWKHEYRQHPDVKKRRAAEARKRAKRPEVKRHLREYRQRPEVKEREQKRKRKLNKTVAGLAQERAKYHRRQARKRNLPDTLTTEQWQATLAHFNGCCAVCGRPPGLWHTIAADHWIPLSAEDCPGTVASNMVPLCHGDNGCNNSKGNRDPLEWLIDTYGPRKGRRIHREITEYLEGSRQAARCVL